MKAINIRKYDIICPCISGSKITALCGIGDRIHRVELKNKNISGLNQKGFFKFCFLFCIATGICTLLHGLSTTQKTLRTTKICNETDQSMAKSTEKKISLLFQRCLLIFCKLYTHDRFDCSWVTVFSGMLCTTYLAPWEDREHYKEYDKVKAVSFRKKEAGDERVWWTHFSPVLYQRATVSHTWVAVSDTVTIIFRDTVNLYLLYWKQLRIELWSTTFMTVFNFRLQYTSSRSCSLAYASSNAYVAIGKMDEFAEICKYHLQKLFSIRPVKCFFSAHSCMFARTG